VRFSNLSDTFECPYDNSPFFSAMLDCLLRTDGIFTSSQSLFLLERIAIKSEKGSCSYRVTIVVDAPEDESFGIMAWSKSKLFH